MGKLISKVILMMMAACISLSAGAFGDDDKKTTKKTLQTKVENKKPGKVTKTEKEDTLVYDKNVVDDTLTFDDQKTIEDTLIFADDEMMFRLKPKNNNGKTVSLLMKTEKSIPLNPVIYPNPSFGQSKIEMNTPDSTITEITITSQDGVLIRKENATGKSYELSDLAAGNYIITIRNGSEVVQKRLFVK